jgi:hypothetical protein
MSDDVSTSSGTKSTVSVAVSTLKKQHTI